MKNCCCCRRTAGFSPELRLSYPSQKDRHPKEISTTSPVILHGNKHKTPKTTPPKRNSTIPQIPVSIPNCRRMLVPQLVHKTNLPATRCAKTLFQLPCFVNSRNVSVYLSMRTGELQTNAIIENCFQLGFDCKFERSLIARKTGLCAVY